MIEFSSALDAFFEEICAPIPDRLRLIELILGGKTEIIFRNDDQGISGFVVWTPDGTGQALWVRPDRRKTRLAYTLLQQALSEAKAKGAETAKVMVRPQRANLYKHRGFTETYVLLEKKL